MDLLKLVEMMVPPPRVFLFLLLLATALPSFAADSAVVGVDVHTFGARGDGIADDTAALQRALNSGKPLLFPPGTYLAENLTVSNHAELTLLGPEAVLKLKPNDGRGAVTNFAASVAIRYWPNSMKPGGEVVLTPARTNHGVAFMQEFRVADMPFPQANGRRFQCDYPVRSSLTYFVRSLKGWAVVNSPAGVVGIDELAVTNGLFVVTTSQPHGLRVRDDVNLSGFAEPHVIGSLTNHGQLGRALAPGHGFRDGDAVRLVSEEISGPRWGGWFDGLFTVTNATADGFEFWMGGVPSRAPNGVVVAKPCRELAIREWTLASSNAIKVTTTRPHALVEGVPVVVRAPNMPELDGVYRISPIGTNTFRLNLPAPLLGRAAGELRISIETAPEVGALLQEDRDKAQIATQDGSSTGSGVSRALGGEGSSTRPTLGSLNGLQIVTQVLDDRRFAFGRSALPTNITFVHWEPANLLTLVDCRRVQIEMGTVDGNYAASKSGAYALPLVKIMVTGSNKVDSIKIRNTRFYESAGRCGQLVISSAVYGGRRAQGGAGLIKVENCEFRAWGNGSAIALDGAHNLISLHGLSLSNDGEAGWSEPNSEWYGNPAITMNGGNFTNTFRMGEIAIRDAECEYAAGLCGGGYGFKSLVMENCTLRGWPRKSDGYHGILPQACKWDDWGEGSPIALQKLKLIEPSTNGRPMALKFAQSLYKGRQGPVRIARCRIAGGLHTEVSPATPRIDFDVVESSFDLNGYSFGVGSESTIRVQESSFSNGRVDSRGLSEFDDCHFKNCVIMVWGGGERGLVFKDCVFEQEYAAADTFLWYLMHEKVPRPVVLLGNQGQGNNPIRLRVASGDPALISLTAISNRLDLPAPGNNLLAPGVRALWLGNSFPDRIEWPAERDALAPLKTRLEARAAEGVATIQLAAGEVLKSGDGSSLDEPEVRGPATAVLIQRGTNWFVLGQGLNGP